MRAVLRRAVGGFFANDCPLAAAAIAYYVLLSIFPLILIVIILGSNVLPPRVLEEQILSFINQYVAGSRGILRSVVRGLDQHRTSLSVIAIAGLVWSGMGIFGALRAALNQAWGVRETRSFWQQRRLELTFALMVGGLFVLSTGITFGLDQLVLPHQRGVHLALTLLRLLAGSAIALVGFTITYELVPCYQHRTWRASLLAGAVATVLFEVAKWAFLHYVTEFSDYSLVYGAVGGVIVFLLWAYATASILLFGGQLARELEAVQAVPGLASNI